MADVLIVCVREDEPQAKALAEMFEAAGFSIGGAPSSDGALRSSGAGVVVWSQASIRSRPFLDAAQRVINAEKAVVASLIEPPPPSSIGSSPAFDLSHWDGDPNDPALDPLFFAVDRMVNAARATAGAPVRQEEYPAAPPPAAAPPPRAARTKPVTPAAPTRPIHESLDAEAEHWRAIRDSRDPADFMDYLARYGPAGAFAEVAELKLKQLAGGHPSPRATPRPAPTPMRQRSEAPAPVRRPEALPPTTPRRTVDVAPAPRRPRPPERSYDRPADLRGEPPPRGEGGPVRAFVLIALLGGAALAGGLYFGGGIDLGSRSPSEQVAEAAPNDALDTPGAVPVGEDGAGGPSFLDPDFQRQAQSTAARRPTQTVAAAPTQTRERAGPSSSAERATAAVPAPVTNFGMGGPISLSPNEAGVQPGAPVSLDPPATAQPPASSPALFASATPPPAQTISRVAPTATVSWAQRPTARRITDLYPSRALREGLGGRVQMDCVVQANLSVACTIASETPPGMGFGSAALSAANSYRAQAQLSDGTSSIGSRARIAVAFQAAQ